jgi:hypothetical protein
MNLQLTIRGYVVGPIWWPVGAECYKDLAYDVTRESARFFRERPTLRSHLNLLMAEHGGDFQSATIAQGELIVTATKQVGATTVRRTRAWPLETFPSIRDYLHPEGQDWAPCFDGEE